jgi:hypothetical protein
MKVLSRCHQVHSNEVQSSEEEETNQRTSRDKKSFGAQVLMMLNIFPLISE